MIKRIIFLSAAIVSLLSCSRTDEIRNGDLVVFCIPGNYIVGKGAPARPERPGDDETIAFHAAMLEVDKDGKVNIIFSSSRKEVHKVPFLEGLQECALSHGELPEMHFLRVKDRKYDADASVRRANHYIGTPFDKFVYIGDDEIYCAELMYYCCLDSKGESVFPLGEMNFRSSRGFIYPYFRWLFDWFETPLPQGRTGLLPSMLLQSDKVKELENVDIYKYLFD